MDDDYDLKLISTLRARAMACSIRTLSLYHEIITDRVQCFSAAPTLCSLASIILSGDTCFSNFSKELHSVSMAETLHACEMDQSIMLAPWQFLEFRVDGDTS